MEKYAFENLDIYQKSIDYVLSIRKLCKETKSDYDILDRLKRAALSISLNIAEGNARFHVVRYYKSPAFASSALDK